MNAPAVRPAAARGGQLLHNLLLIGRLLRGLGTAVGRFRFHRFPVGGDQHAGHQAQ